MQGKLAEVVQMRCCIDYKTQNNPKLIELAWCYAFRDETRLTLLTFNDKYDLFLRQFHEIEIIKTDHVSMNIFKISYRIKLRLMHLFHRVFCKKLHPTLNVNIQPFPLNRNNQRYTNITR